MSTVVMTHRSPTKVDIQFRYAPDMVELIKVTIPGFARSFEPSTKVWSTDPSWAKVFADMLRAQGHTVSETKLAPKTPKLPPPLPPAAPVTNWAQELLGRCSPELRVSVFRNLSKALHSDIGGDGALQRELNDARTELDSPRKGESA